MPYKLVKKGGNKPWKIINTETGKTKGSSTSKAKAKKSARAAMAGEHGWKPTGKRRKK